MAAILLHTFGGEVPRTTPRLLEQTQATLAVNCDLSRGALEALRGPRIDHALSRRAKSIFKHDVDGWLTWDGVVTVVKSAVLDADGDRIGHTFLCGDSPWPTQYLSGGTEYRLGLPRPMTAPKVVVQRQAASASTTRVYGFGAEDIGDAPGRYGIDVVPNVEGDGITLSAYGETSDEIDTLKDESSVMRSTAYCYTLVRSIAGGVIQQESAPSPPSPVVDVEHGDGVRVSGFVIPGGADMHVTHIRIYRTVSGTQSSEFRFLTELTAGTQSYLDTAHDKDVPIDVLRTSMWDAIPDDAKGLIKTDNGIYAAFRGNEVLISEPFVPYAFPTAYRLTVEDTIVALAHTDNTIIVLTTGRPYLASGSVPESLQLTHLPIEQACVSAASVASLPGGVLYASPDGLMLFSSNEQTIATGQTFTREQWQELKPETLLGTVHDGRYVAFFQGTNRGIIFSVGAKDVVRVELPTGWRVWCLYHHSQDDAVYVSADTPSGPGVYKLEAGEPLAYQWKSKEFFTSQLVSMSSVRVEGGQSGEHPVQVSVFGPDDNKVRASVRIRDSRTKRLRTTRSEKIWRIAIQGKTPVYEMRMSNSVEGVEYGG